MIILFGLVVDVVILLIIVLVLIGVYVVFEKNYINLINRYEKMMKGLNCWVNLLIKVVLGVYLLGEV